ncbi:MAG: hypothetical protein JOZ78_17145 [Chroococcidiopsidaceae cyanobacterium CP_BM_ER_R8_30]|nr:hypothetical protein [Chroococcidiopsidaceae cyanobacterium CP_BM_ER_R8_30]
MIPCYATNLLLQGLDPSHAKRLTWHQSERAFRRYTLWSEQEAAITAYYPCDLRGAGEKGSNLT